MAVGGGAAALSVGFVGGTVGTRVVGDLGQSSSNVPQYGGGLRLDYERKPNGDIEFDDPVSGTHFETKGDDVEYDDPFTRSRERPNEGIYELEIVGRPGSFVQYLDLERKEDKIEFTLDVGDEFIEAEWGGDEYELFVGGLPLKFEADRDDVEYRGGFFTFETDGPELDVRGDLRFDFDGVDDTRLLDFGVDFRTDSGRFRNTSVELDLEYDRLTGDFEAKRFI
ncbi:hypothetical protein [Haloarchaeobius sp. DFWS5]|uniref:hypothetical protein n=1 Tax=Haloarchaeobius sp. DFWS5 TaxID=3446114 RepID=UPI003EBEF1C5